MLIHVPVSIHRIEPDAILLPIFSLGFLQPKIRTFSSFFVINYLQFARFQREEIFRRPSFVAQNSLDIHFVFVTCNVVMYDLQLYNFYFQTSAIVCCKNDILILLFINHNSFDA